MKYATVRLVFDRKKLATRQKTGLVQIEVGYRRQRKWIGTGVKVFSDQWSEKYRVVNHPEAREMNKRLAEQLAALEEFISSQIKEDVPFSFERLEAFIRKEEAQTSFIEFVEDRINDRGDIRTSTKKTHCTLLNALYEFGKIRDMSDITKANIKRFDDWLHAQGYKQTTVWGYHKRLKSYINEAIRFEIISSNPYNFLKFERGKSAGIKYLLKEEIDAIANHKYQDKYVERARDMFLFQCYTGLAYSDLAKFDWNNVEEKNGRYFIRDKRLKTDEEYFIMLLTPALEVLRKYKFKLPIISNEKYNDYLKIVAGAAGIAKPISSHWARHSYAVMALSMGVRMEIVSKMMGHASTRVTESTYAKVLATDLKDGYEIIEGKLK